MVVLTANQTSDGAPVYLTAQRDWSRKLTEAHVIESDGERDELLAVAEGQQALVCDPYVFKVKRDGDAIEPVSARERIRSVGPTIDYLNIVSPKK